MIWGWKTTFWTEKYFLSKSSPILPAHSEPAYAPGNVAQAQFTDHTDRTLWHTFRRVLRTKWAFESQNFFPLVNDKTEILVPDHDFGRISALALMGALTDRRRTRVLGERRVDSPGPERPPHDSPGHQTARSHPL